MDGQDEGSRRIYNQREISQRRRIAVRTTFESSSRVVSKKEKKNSSLDEA